MEFINLKEIPIEIVTLTLIQIVLSKIEIFAKIFIFSISICTMTCVMI